MQSSNPDTEHLDRSWSRSSAGQAGQTARSEPLVASELRTEGQAGRILELIANVGRFDGPLRPEMNLVHDLGFDSLRRVELISNVEEALKIRFVSETAIGCLTVSDLLDAIQQNLKGGGVRDSGASVRFTWERLLATSPKNSIVANYVVAPRPGQRVLNVLILKAIWLLAKMLFRLEVSGRENIPRTGPYIICSNHQGYLDGFLLSSILPYSVIYQIFYLGTPRYFSGGFKDWLAWFSNTIPIDPDSDFVDALTISAIGLQKRKILLIFPEGGMCCDGNIQPFKRGAALLARELNIPILPMAIKGSFNTWSKRSNHFHFSKVRIAIGQLRELPSKSLQLEDRSEEYSELTAIIEDDVTRLFAKL